MMMHQHQTTPVAPSHQHHHINSAPPSVRSPHQLPSPTPLSLDPNGPARIRLSDILPYDGAPVGPYIKTVEALSGSLMRHNAAVIELGTDDMALIRCALEAARFYFRTRSQSGKGGRGVCMYRAGR
ncbi:RING/U-box superfamily protein [Forsythia ovata]